MIEHGRNRSADAAAEFVRGDASWHALEKLGVCIRIDEARLELEPTANVPVVRVQARDVARGLLHHWASGTELREWARILLAASFIEIVDLEEVDDGELLLDALWCASEGVDIPERALELARRLVGGPLTRN